MKIRSFIIAYGLMLTLLLFADRRPGTGEQNRYSHVVDLTGSVDATPSLRATRIIAPDALIPGTWSAGQIPAERLVAPLVVMDLKAAAGSKITLDEIAQWESQHGVVTQGSLVAIRRPGAPNGSNSSNVSSVSGDDFPITADAAQFLMDARYVLGFAVESSTNLPADRSLARQIALHGNYVVDRAARFSSLPDTGSLVIVAPAKSRNNADNSVRILAMVK